MKAIEIKKLEGFTGDARLYRLNPSFYGHKFVVVSATVAPFSGPETYIFPADENGEVTSWGELAGSFRGELDHKKALGNIGYEVEVYER